jgi:hypothetical protein
LTTNQQKPGPVRLATEQVAARFAPGTFHRIGAVLYPDETRSDFIRQAVDAEIQARLTPSRKSSAQALAMAWARQQEEELTTEYLDAATLLLKAIEYLDAATLLLKAIEAQGFVINEPPRI